MTGPMAKELRRRSLVKALLWRVIGVVWTWIGAYIILRLVPPSHRSAALIATLIVIYHHSTRMIMYYVYERIWASIAWGREVVPRSMSRRERVLWSIGTTLALALIFFLLLDVHPGTKTEQSADIPVATTSDSTSSMQAVEPYRSSEEATKGTGQ